MHAREDSGRNPLSGSRVGKGPTMGRVLVAVAFFTYLCVFVWRYVDTQLLYHGDTVVLTPTWWISFPWFHTGWDFFCEHLTGPGGLATYGAAWLAQYFCYPFAGAVVFTLLGATIFGGTIFLGQSLSMRRSWVTAYLAPLAVLGIASSYAFPLAALVGLAIALLAVAIYGLFVPARWNVAARGVMYAALCLLVFWTAAGNCLVVAISCGLIEWLRGKHRWLALVYLMVGCLVVLSGNYLDLMNRSDEGFHFTWTRLFEDSYRSAIPTAIYAGQIAAMLLWSWFIGHRARRKDEQQQSPSRAARDQMFRDIVGTVLLAGSALLVSFGTFDTESHSLLRANYLARMGRWSEMLEEITLQPPAAYAPGLLYDINRSLFETRQLSDRMFSFPQEPQFLIQFGSSAIPYRGCHELLLALGCVNEAEQTAFEALEARGPLPYILRELVVISILKDRPEAARVFLKLLSRDVIHRSWARSCLEQLQHDPQLESDKEISRLRWNMLRVDRLSVASYELFDLLLEQNPGTRMAFEYRAAHYLLTHRIEKIEKLLPLMREVGFDRVPTHYAEAMLLHWKITRRPPDLGDWRIDSDSLSRFQEFVKLTQSPNEDPATMMELLSGTYYEYYYSRKNMSL